MWFSRPASRVAARLALLATLAMPSAAAEPSEAPELVSGGRMQEAVKALLPVTTSSSQNAQSFNLLCRAYYGLERWDDAISACQRSVALVPDSSEYHLWLGRAYGMKADHSGWFTALRYARRTRNEFERAVELNNASVDARADLAEYYLEAPGFLGGGDDKARKQAEAMAQYNTPAAHWVKAKLLEKDKKNAEAEAEYRAAIAESKNPGGEWLNLASFYRRTDRLKDMQDAIHMAIESDKKKGNVLYEAAKLLVRSGRNFPEAAQCLRKYIAGDKKVEDAPEFQAHYLLGTILEKQGDKQGAAEEYRAALALAADYKQAQEALKRVNR